MKLNIELLKKRKLMFEEALIMEVVNIEKYKQLDQDVPLTNKATGQPLTVKKAIEMAEAGMKNVELSISIIDKLIEDNE